MSTHAAIGYQTSEGFCLQYSHYDGYPEHVGKILVNHFNTFAQARAIVEGGPAIRMFEEDGTIERFNEDEDGMFIVDTIEEGLNGFDYMYLFDVVKNKWECYTRTPYGGVELVDIPRK